VEDGCDAPSLLPRQDSPASKRPHQAGARPTIAFGGSARKNVYALSWVEMHGSGRYRTTSSGAPTASFFAPHCIHYVGSKQLNNPPHTASCWQGRHRGGPTGLGNAWNDSRKVGLHGRTGEDSGAGCSALGKATPVAVSPHHAQTAYAWSMESARLHLNRPARRANAFLR